MRRRLFEISILLSVLALVATFVSQSPDASLNRSLSLDGTKIGMSYEEVLSLRGLPESLKWEAGTTCFLYGEKSGRVIGVWFLDGRVVYVAGVSLSLNKEHIFGPDQKTSSLLDRFHPFHDLASFLKWSPHSGVSVSTYDASNHETIPTLPIGLRDVKLPKLWENSRADGPRWSGWEPWCELLVDYLGSGDLILGQPESLARPRVGRQKAIFDGGYLRGVSEAEEASQSAYLMHESLSTHLKLGYSPSGPYQMGPPGSGPSWLPRPPTHPHLKIEWDNGKVASLNLFVEDEALFAALRAARAFSQSHRQHL